MKQVRTYKTETEAEFEAGLLQAQGIECEVRDRKQFRRSSRDPSVWVARDEDLPRALEALNHRPDPRGQAWVCPKCKNENEPQFDACWSCDADRP